MLTGTHWEFQRSFLVYPEAELWGWGFFTSDWGFGHTFSLLVLLVLNILVQTECTEGLS